MRRAKFVCYSVLLCLFLSDYPISARSAGYLQTGDFNVIAIIQPAPVAGSARYEADRQIFKETRNLRNTARWAMAVGDVHTDQSSLMHDFGCAMGVSLDPVEAPHLMQLLTRASADTARQTNMAKNYFKRLRPFQIDAGPICEPATAVATSYDYPSGHATLGWTWASILAELMPDRATQILARGRAFGESRIVCGVHNASAVAAARLSASSTLARVRASAEYQADFAAARAELDGLRQSQTALTSAVCSEEQKLVAMNIFAP